MKRTTKLNNQEKAIEKALGKGKLKSVPNVKKEIARLESYAKSSGERKDMRINIRISARDLEALQSFAGDEGLPYQTLISSVLHKFVTGRLVEDPSLRRFPLREEGEASDRAEE